MSIDLDRLYTAQNGVQQEVTRELRAQVEKWGVQPHSDVRYFAILLEEMGEVASAILDVRSPVSVRIRELLESSRDLGEYARLLLEGGEEKEANHEGQDVEHKLIQVAAVAVAFVECRRRKEKQRQG